MGKLIKTEETKMKKVNSKISNYLVVLVRL